MAYQWIRFVYKWADSKWIYIQIDDRRGNYCWLDYVEFDVSFPGYDWYKVVPNMEEWDLRDASYTYDDYFETSEYYYCKDQNELKGDFIKYLENHLADSLYKAATSFHPESNVWGSCYEIAWYVSCIKAAKKDVDMNSLIGWWNDCILHDIKGNLEYYFQFLNIEWEENPWDFYIDRLVSDIHLFRKFNKVKYKNFNIRAYIESKTIENQDEIIEFIKNWKDYFN